MKRIQVSLTDEEHNYITEISKKTGESKSATVRQIVMQVMNGLEPEINFSGIGVEQP